MVITVLNAKVDSDKWTVLENAYRAALQDRTPGLVETFLLHNTSELDHWQIVTVWQDRAALNAMRQSGETPRGVLIFREAGAEPTLSIFDVLGHLLPENLA